MIYVKRVCLILGLLLGLVSGFTILKSRANDARAEKNHPPLGAFVMVGDTRVHYVQSGSGPVLVLIHGAGGNLRDFTFQLMEKLAKTHTVIAFDRPGHGYTDTLHDRGESLAEQATLLRSALQKIGHKTAIIGGYSFGGAVALRWALDSPETTQGLLLMSSVSNPWVLPPSYLYALASGRISGPIFAASVSAFAPKSLVDDTLSGLFAPNEPPTGYLEYIGAGLSMRKVSLRSNGRQVTNLLPHIEEQSPRYPELTMPVEIIHGADDTSVPASIHADVLSKQLPHAHYQRLDHMGHSTNHSAHTEILAAIARITTQISK